MSRNINPYGLRMSPALRKELEASATASNRSLNAEIVTRLTRSLEADGIFLNGGQSLNSNKIYTVQPGNLGEASFDSRYKKKGVDYLTLTVAIETGEQQIEKEKKELSPRKKALLFSLLYDSIDDEQADVRIIDQKTMKMLMELAG